MVEKKKKTLSRLKSKYKLTVSDDNTLKEVMSFYLSGMNVFTYVGIFIILIAFITSLLFVFTPLNVLLPHSTDTKLQRKIIQNALMIDSLEQQIKAQNLYTYQLRNILQGKMPVDTFSKTTAMKDTAVDISDLDFSPSELDSILRAQIEREEKVNLSVIEDVQTSTSLKNLHFYMPVKGTVTNGFNLDEGHLGIDIVAGPNEAIMAALSGTVIMATWSLETGYVLVIQHDNDLITFYKHNSVLLKKTGDRVEAGESVAIIGNSGEQSTGPHLHFELWNKGVPLDPQNYIAF
jgi:murein DD-endopeptidase MepM/ murein hydrolase activator NlpD